METNKYTWDTSILVKNQDDYNKKIEKLQQLAAKLLSYRGKLSEQDMFVSLTMDLEEYSKVAENLLLFLSLKQTQNKKDHKAIGEIQKLSFMLEKTQKELTFIDVEKKHFSNAYINQLATLPQLFPYKRDLLKIKEDKKHILKEEEEKLLCGAVSCFDYYGIFKSLSTSELAFEPIKMPNGKLVKINESTASVYRTHKDHNVRKQAALSVLNAYKKHNLTIAQNYAADIKADEFVAKAKNFKNSLSAELYSEEISENVYNNLIESVHDNLGWFYKYAGLRKKLLGGKISIVDFSNPLFAASNKKYTYEDSLEMVNNALSILGEDYLQKLNNLAKGGYVDVFPKQNKETGAFQTSDLLGHQFVMLNHVGTYDSVSTIAHEFGHAMHSAYTEENQPFNNRSYSIFVAEVASTVNEILLANHMMNLQTKQKAKMGYIEKLLMEVASCVFRQTMFAEFEQWAHEQVENGKSLTYNDLNNKYKQLLRLYFGKNVKIYNEYQYEWSRVPHFYSSFYVYKYATGLLAAMLIVDQLQTVPNFEKQYKKFLSAGSSDKPTELLKIVNVDFEKKETFDKAFNIYKKWIKQMEDYTAKC